LHQKNSINGALTFINAPFMLKIEIMGKLS